MEEEKEEEGEEGLYQVWRWQAIGEKEKRVRGQLTFQLDIDLTGHPAASDTFLSLFHKSVWNISSRQKKNSWNEDSTKPIVAAQRVKDG